MDAINPATGESIATYEMDDADAVEQALDRADTVSDEWRERPLREREKLLENAAAVLRDHADEYAELMTRGFQWRDWSVGIRTGTLRSRDSRVRQPEDRLGRMSR